MSAVEQAIRDHLERERPRGVVSAYLFGSEARGAAHRESDVDVGVVLDRRALGGGGAGAGAGADRTTRGRVAERLASELIAATHRNEVDVVVLDDAPPELAAAVVTGGRRVYCADAEADHAFVRNALLRYADLRPFLARTRKTKLETLAR